MSAPRTRSTKTKATAKTKTKATDTTATQTKAAKAVKAKPTFTEPLEPSILGNTLTKAQVATLREGGDVDLHDPRTKLNLTVTASARVEQGVRMLGIRRICVPPDVNTSIIRKSSDIRAIMQDHTVAAHPADDTTQEGQPS